MKEDKPTEQSGENSRWREEHRQTLSGKGLGAGEILRLVSEECDKEKGWSKHEKRACKVIK
jgi:hypothetical protein